MNTHKAYLVLMALELTCIGIKYGDSASDTNSFQQPGPTFLLFMTAVFSHVLSSTGDMTEQSTIITFHVSGVVGCETLLWILLPHFLCYYIINLLFLLIATFHFFNYVTQLLCSFNCFTPHTPSKTDLVPNIQPQSQEPKL